MSKDYPLFRLKLVIAGDFHEFSNWLRDNPMKEGEDIIFVRDYRSLAGRQRENVEWIKYGTWYKNKKAIEAVSKHLGIPESEI